MVKRYTLDEIVTIDAEFPGQPPPRDPSRPRRPWCVPHIVCKDGTTLSVQASHGHYCSPREDCGPWASVEVGYPSVAPEGEFLARAESPHEPTQSVYGWVPVSEVRAYIAAHGGEKE